MCMEKEPLVGYLKITFFPQLSQVARNLNNFPLMFALMRVAWSLLQNEHIHIEPYVSYCFNYFRSSQTNASCFSGLFSAYLIFLSFLNVHQLHQLMPSVITCLVAKRLGNKFTDNHWELRNFTAKLVASICKR